VFVALSVPLGIALRDIAYETRAINTVKSTLLVPFEGQDARISDVGIVVPRKGDIQVAATILTQSRVEDAQARLTTDLSNFLGRPVEVSLAQVLIDENKSLEAQSYLQMADKSLAAPLRAKISQLEAMGQMQATAADLRRAVPFALTAADIDPEARTATLVASKGSDFDVPAYRRMEAGLAANFEGWTITVVPPPGALPRILFEEGSDKIAGEGEAALADCVWALKRWSSAEVEAVGFASSNGDQRYNRSLAERRGKAIAERLAAAGITATASGDYRGARQSTEERKLGLEHFQTGLVRPVT
jgi:outer membrane protein OmpA-like peptidoglycan-associated protein